MVWRKVTGLFPLFFRRGYAILESDTGKKVGAEMDYMKYITIQVIKKSERSEVVFAAMDEMDVPVVVKKLQGANPEIYRGIAKLRNSHIPKIYCVEEQGEELCIAEEYIDGRTLDVYLAEENLTDVQKLELMVQLCEALEVLHQCKPPVIHRDIKPSNVLITGDGVLKVIDFDASRQYKTEKNTSDTRLLGTIEYAAPEQFGYAQTDVRSDIYSVGVVFSEVKIESEAPFAKIWKRIVDKCTSFDPENRYKTVTELKKDLLKCIDREKNPLWKRWLVPTMAAGVVLVMLAAGGVQQQREKSREEQGNFELTPTGQVVDTVELPTKEPENVKKTEPYKKSMKPEDVTEVYIPNVRWGYLGEDGEYRIGKRLAGEQTEKVGYSCRGLMYKDARDVSWKLHDNDTISLTYEKQNGQLLLEFSEVFDMKYCNRLVVRAKNEAGNIAVVLYDEDCKELERWPLDKTEGTWEFSFYPEKAGIAEYIGFMANDEGLSEYAEFKTTIYYVDFYMLNPENEKISYEPADLVEEMYYNLTRDYMADGSVCLDFSRVYGAMYLSFPEPVKMKEGDTVSVVVDTGGKYVTFGLLDEEMNVIECSYDYRTERMEEVMLDITSNKTVYGIEIMLDEKNDGDSTYYKDGEVAVQSIHFYQ